MEFGNKLKALRTERGISQEELADAVYVTRQTISNWETSKSYPDLKSLLMLSDYFSVSLDYLVKGDLKKMKEINEKEIRKFSRLGAVYTALFIAVLLTPIPLAKFLGWWALAVYLPLIAAALWVAVKLEKLKKNNNISTFKEVDAFMAGKRLDEVEALKEEAKRPYQQILGGIACAVLALLVCALMAWLMGKI